MECMESSDEGKAEVLEAAMHGLGKKPWAEVGSGRTRTLQINPWSCSWRLKQAGFDCSWTPHEHSDTFTRHLRDSEGGIPNPSSNGLT